MIESLLLFSALSTEPVAAPIANPVFAPIYVEACTPKTPRQTIEYPPELIGTEIFGKVELVLFLNACGDVRHVIISKSSGTPALDNAAVANVKSWVISPVLAHLQPGLGGMVRVPVQFQKHPEP